MPSPFAEVGFDALLTIASGFALAAWALGLFVAPTAAAGVALLFVLAGAWLLAPAGERAVAGGVGLVAVLLAGVALPRYVLGSTGDMPTTLAISGAVLLLAFLLLRATAFTGARADAV